MANTIKVNPDKLDKNAAKLEKVISSYKKNSDKLIKILDTNEADFDDTVLAALKESCEKIRTESDTIKTNMDTMADVLRKVAKAFDEADKDAKKQLQKCSV
ncbi:MAG: hypothetical protein IJM14_09870 [Lachnospiraceae bacterium]|nr:hypothetical protein [Lachnospiraceae bacterium]